MGQLGDTRLFLMGALLLADELAEPGRAAGGLQAELARMQAELGRVENRAVAALESAAAKIDLIVAE